MSAIGSAPARQLGSGKDPQVVIRAARPTSQKLPFIHNLIFGPDRLSGSAAIRYPTPWRSGLHQRVGAIRISVQRRRKHRRRAASIRYKCHRRCPAVSLLGLGCGDQRGDRPFVVVELRCHFSAVMPISNFYAALVEQPCPARSPSWSSDIAAQASPQACVAPEGRTRRVGYLETRHFFRLAERRLDRDGRAQRN